jgi:hypothetical protein
LLLFIRSLTKTLHNELQCFLHIANKTQPTWHSTQPIHESSNTHFHSTVVFVIELCLLVALDCNVFNSTSAPIKPACNTTAKSQTTSMLTHTVHIGWPSRKKQKQHTTSHRFAKTQLAR